jgi:hypothetical protein
VNERQVRHCGRKSAGRRDLALTVVEQAPAKQADINLKAGAPEACFDRDLPQAHGAEEDIVAPLLDQTARGARESFRLDRAPNENVGVEQWFILRR